MVRPLAALLALLLAPALAGAEQASAVGGSAPAGESVKPAGGEAPLPAPIILHRPRRARIGLGGLFVSPRRDLERDGETLVTLDPSAGMQAVFGYPADSDFSFLVGFRYFWLRSTAGTQANSSLGYYDFGMGTRYTLPIGELTDFICEAMVTGASVKFRNDGGDFFGQQAKTGFGLLVRAGAVIMLGPTRALVVSGSYSVTRTSNFFGVDDEKFYPTFLSFEIGIEWKL